MSNDVICDGSGDYVTVNKGADKSMKILLSNDRASRLEGADACHSVVFSFESFLLRYITNFIQSLGKNAVSASSKTLLTLSNSTWNYE